MGCVFRPDNVGFALCQLYRPFLDYLLPFYQEQPLDFLHCHIQLMNQDQHAWLSIDTVFLTFQKQHNVVIWSQILHYRYHHKDGCISVA